MGLNISSIYAPKENMEKILEILTVADNPFVAIYRLFEYGWEIMGWWFIVALIVKFFIEVYLYERYIAGTRTWNLH